MARRHSLYGKSWRYSTISMVDHSEAAFNQFFQVALQKVGGWLQSEGISKIARQHQVFYRPNRIETETYEELNYSSLLQQHKDELMQLSEADQCLQALWAAGYLEKLVPKYSSIKYADLPDEQIRILKGELYAALLETCQRSAAWPPSKNEIQAIYQQYIHGWMTDSTVQTVLAPLLNFTSEIEEDIVLGHQYHIAPLTDAEKTYYWSIVTFYDGRQNISRHILNDTNFKIAGQRTQPHNRLLQKDNEKKEKVIQAFMQSHEHMLTEMRDILTALRLHKGGDVGVAPYLEMSDELHRNFPAMGLPGRAGYDFQSRPHGTQYLLTAPDLLPIQELFAQLKRLEGDPHQQGLETGLRRFNQSYGRETFEDWLIDLTVALESTLLAGMKSQTELKYRFTQRGTALLGTKRSPQELHKLLSQMYDARSAVVHAGKFVGEIAQKKGGKDTLGLSAKEFLLACEEVTREILVVYLHRIVARTTLSTVEKVNEALELHMIQNLNSPTE